MLTLPPIPPFIVPLPPRVVIAPELWTETSPASMSRLPPIPPSPPNKAAKDSDATSASGGGSVSVTQIIAIAAVAAVAAVAVGWRPTAGSLWSVPALLLAGAAGAEPGHAPSGAEFDVIAAGEAGHVFQSGQPMSIELAVKADKPCDDFVFGIAMFNSDGTCVYGTNTDIEEYQADGLLINSIKSCNSFSAGQLLILREVEKRTGKPAAFNLKNQWRK
mgnify:CR=1 FL=1